MNPDGLPERLRVSVQAKLQGSPLFVVANREPYMHVLGESGVSVLVPASGLVTAMEPVLLACDGTWIAHGSGNADRTVTDEHDRVRVPPDHPRYTLRRVWLTNEEEKGYYYGLANEGLWPLCHIAHTRPTFRPDDWQQYQAVNRKFADAVLEEMDDGRAAGRARAGLPLRAAAAADERTAAGRPGRDLLAHSVAESGGVRDLPVAARAARRPARRRSDRLPHAVPLQQFPGDGRAQPGGARRVGAVRRQPERPHDDGAAVSDQRRGRRDARRTRTRRDGRATRRRCVRTCGGSWASRRLFLGVGVDRVDYTKGIIERFRGIERFLEKFDAFLEQFTFVQIAAPSRTDIDRYAEFLRSVEAEAERINRRFQRHSWKPIVLQVRHHSHEEIARYYRAADFCLVTSLHDGMNLVAKEFVASRSDEDGVLILSTFAGAARELPDALIVNPYDIDALADSIHQAIDMGPRERGAPDAPHAAGRRRTQRLSLGRQPDLRVERDSCRKVRKGCRAMSEGEADDATTIPWWTRVAPRVRAARRCALFLDFDGTLAELTKEPEAARL